MTNNDDLVRFSIRATGTEAAGYAIPAPPAGHPLHGRTRAGFVGDDRPLACRLADPRAPKDLGAHATHGEAVRALSQHP